MVVGSGVVLSAIGIAVGLGASFLFTRVIASLLYGVRSWDPLTFLTVSLTLIAMATLASYIPARRAANLDPMVALRSE
jgi:ABC-type antimicrobial peptide transport system permease subunit